MRCTRVRTTSYTLCYTSCHDLTHVHDLTAGSAGAQAPLRAHARVVAEEAKQPEHEHGVEDAEAALGLAQLLAAARAVVYRQTYLHSSRSNRAENL